jgi:hypothetical protein
MDPDNNYILSYFDCLNDEIVWIEPIQRCKACRSGICDGCDDVIIQKRIWKQVGVPSSQRASVLSYIAASSNSAFSPPYLNWNQSSNNLLPSVQTKYVPSRGNSTKGSVTSIRPGALSAGGVGVDLKHNSYARYLCRINTNTLCASMNNTPAASGTTFALYGNKLMAYGILSSTC